MPKPSLANVLDSFLAQLAIAENGGLLLTATTKIVVGVSGGPDSLALLHLLAQEGRHPAEKLVVAHLNHGIRPAADSEAAFVAAVAAKWGLACHVGHVDVPVLARAERLSLEEAGRMARYRFLARVAHEEAAALVAVAHHADDQAETVLMHILRGSGLAGLRGMAAVGKVPEAPELTLVRPLLAVTRAEIEAYCREHGLHPLMDESNLDTSLFRNRLRHELLPILSSYNPQIVERLQQMAITIAADEVLLEGLSQQAWPMVVLAEGENWLELWRQNWQSQPLGLRRRLLRQGLARLRPSLRDVSFTPVEQARRVAEAGKVGAQASLPGGVTLLVGYDRLRLTGSGVAVPTELPQLCQERPEALPAPGNLTLGNGWSIHTRFIAIADQPPAFLNEPQYSSDVWHTAIDAGKLDGLVLRPRQPGERFQPLGMGGRSATVKKVMINRKIPAALRDRWPIVATGSHLVWLVGHQLDERARLTPATSLALHIELRRNEDCI